MNQVILFSPVGGTDPISLSNCRDGSLLHICRVYRPSKVILYMSKEILDKQKEDNRYKYCLDLLAKKQGRTMEYKDIERPELTNVQEFDYFYQDFRKIITDVVASMDGSDSLLLNVSSGTPAMKSGLLVLKTLGEFPCRLIQVSTPERGMNEHIHKGYDVNVLWELNEDNADNFENRCREIKCPTLSAIKTEEIIKKHISVYDYQAAVLAAQTLPAEYTENYLDILQMAEARLLLDSSVVDKILNKHKSFVLPVRGGDSRTLFEYALTLDIKLRRLEYSDFIRAITPLIVDLFELILKKQCSLDIGLYTREDRHGVVRWDSGKLKTSDVIKKLEEKYYPFTYGPVSSEHLNILIQAYAKDNRLKDLADSLRNVEKNIRNLAAHQIISITDETIQKLTGLTAKNIMDKIKDIFAYTGINIKKEYWNSYDDINHIIQKAMQSVLQ